MKLTVATFVAAFAFMMAGITFAADAKPATRTVTLSVADMH